MAKDKSKKKDAALAEEPKKKSKAAPEKASKKSKGGDEEFAKPSEAPATSDGWQFENDDHIGDLFLITPLREDEHESNFAGKVEIKKHIVADIVHINEKKPAKSELHEDAWVFGGWSRGSLRGFIGESRLVVRLDRDPSKKVGNNIPWVLLDPTDDDIEKVREYLASVDPFKVKK